MESRAKNHAEALNVLGLPDNASMKDVRKSFKVLTLTKHPDKFVKTGHNDEERLKVFSDNFTRITEARDYLVKEFQEGRFGGQLPPDTMVPPSKGESDQVLRIGDGNLEAESRFMAEQDP